MDGGDHSASGRTKRSFEDDESDTSVSKKRCTCTKVDEEAAMIVSLTESLQSCKDELASCQSELESAKAEVDKWNTAFKQESFVPSRKSPEPQFVIDYIQTLKSSEKSLKEELEIAQMKLAIRDLKSQLKPESMKLQTDEDPEVDGEEQGSTPAGTSRMAYLEDELRAANTVIAEMREIQAVRVDALEKAQATHAKEFEYLKNNLLTLQQSPRLVLTAAPENADAQK
ncbi:BnaC06g42510D [Brassica napus]|uniref:BnaC06g42510D protein n=1 Tax=Brassica napus TaxID=3708 RepID=A0A078IR70_BRANA|nr:BnaC06g42510D [Brassica napus]